MSINLNQIYGMSNWNGIGGLVSGIDTDTLVEQMLSRSKSRINKEYQAKQTLLYKQEAYRDISSKMLSFQSKYLSYSTNSDTNILSSKFFESNKVSSSSKYVSVSGNVENIKNFSIDTITSVAKAASFASSKNVANETITSKTILDENSESFSNSENYISFNYNGIDKKINMSELSTDAKSAANHIQDELNEAFGTGKVSFLFNDESKEFNISANGDTNTLKISGISSDLSGLTGISVGDSNRLNLSESLDNSSINGLINADEYKININGENFTFSKDRSIKDILSEINSNKNTGVKISYSNISNSFSATSTITGDNSKIEISDIEGNLASSLFGKSEIDYNIEKGTDANITYTLNGVTNSINRSSNSFDIDGININLQKEASNITSPIKFEVTQNVDETMDKISQFVNDYNELITLIGSKLNERPNRAYQPLTPDQEDIMEKDDIDKWTKEAKKGALFNDSLLNGAYRKMREVMYSRTGVSNLTLFDVGISTSSGDLSGKLSIDKDKLKEALLNNSEEVEKLFIGTSSTNEKSGIAVQLSAILIDNVGLTGTSGSLIREAGSSTGVTSKTNNISLKIDSSDDRLSSLKSFLERERERYYNKFATLERMMSNMNSQSLLFSNMYQQ